jgi:hypothetical protein
MPVLAADIFMISVAAAVDSNTEDNEDLSSGLARLDKKKNLLFDIPQ